MRTGQSMYGGLSFSPPGIHYPFLFIVASFSFLGISLPHCQSLWLNWGSLFSVSRGGAMTQKPPDPQIVLTIAIGPGEPVRSNDALIGNAGVKHSLSTHMQVSGFSVLFYQSHF